MVNKPTQKMAITFTETERKSIEGDTASIAKKHHCSRTYVWQVIANKRNNKSSKAKEILNDALKLVKFKKRMKLI